MQQILCSTKSTIKILLKHLFNIKKNDLKKVRFHEQHFDKPDSFTVNRL